MVLKKEIKMNKLYKVTCDFQGYSSLEHLDIFVIANTSSEAEEKAISAMKSLDWKYDDGISNIEIIADSKVGSSVALLVEY
jgi:hypothetical protein